MHQLVFTKWQRKKKKYILIIHNKLKMLSKCSNIPKYADFAITNTDFSAKDSEFSMNARDILL